MREILFRGKSIETIETGRWVQGFYQNEEYNEVYEKPCAMAEKHYIVNQDDTVEVDAQTVGQFTGLLDKNGKRIFEGDILCVNDIQKVYVFFERGQFVVNHFAINVLCDRNIESVIVGNIHDNPELIECEV